MVYRKAKQKVRRIYSRGKSIFGGDLLKNPIAVGLLAGVAKNALSGKKIIDIEIIKKRISKVDGTNPLIFLVAGILAKNPLITTIGMFGIVDPPDEKKEELSEYSNIGESEYSNIGESEYSNIGESEYSNIGESEYSNIGGNEETVEYSNIGENEKTIPKKRCVF